MPILDRILYGSDLRLKRIPVPRRQVDQDGISSTDKFGGARLDLLHELPVIAVAAHTVQTSQAGQDHLHVLGCQKRPVHPVSVHDTDAAARSLRCAYGNPCLAQIFNIAVYRSLRDLKPLRQRRGRGFFFLQQYR